jgi:hypothetical protein
MSSSRRDDNQILAPKVLLKLMTQLANFETLPSEWQENTEELKENSARGTGIHPRNKPELIEVVYPGERPKFINQLREATQRYWPDLWKNEEQACQVLKRIQVCLRRFWLAPDQYARDWYIHRARHVVQRFRVLHELALQDELVYGFPQKLETANEVHHRNARIEELLDNLPVHIPFEDALYELQRRAAGIPSKRPLFCPNTNCKKRYFLSDRKGTKYCTPECFQADSGRPSKRASWHKNKNEWRKR